MKVALAASYMGAKGGGGARAATRLMTGLQRVGTECMGMSLGQGAIARRRPLLDALPLLRYRKRTGFHWSCGWLHHHGSVAALRALSPDLVHLHWINHGLLAIRDLAVLPQPLVWTLHDSWAFTGGCHLPGDCTRFELQCGDCPQLHSGRDADLSRRIWLRKERFWGELPLCVITPTAWLAERARRSSLFAGKRVVVLPNGLDTECFQPEDRRTVRARLGLPQDVPLILFGATHGGADPNKGADVLRDALRLLVERGSGRRAEAIVLGTDSARELDLPLPCHCLGALAAEADLAAAFAAADITVVPSRQENLPYMAMESMACGTPVAAFRIGGIPELIDHEETGWLAPAYDVAALASGMASLLKMPEAGERAACIVRSRYSLESVARQHVALYEELCDA